ncbi:hypothetical protein VTH82DRAFT_3923 [Thermothelomyces myriococcoides]
MGYSGNTADNDCSISTRVIITCAICPSIALFFVALRLYTARTILRTVRLDDWLMVFSVAYSISICSLLELGLGYHRKYLEAHIGPIDFASWFKINIIPATMTVNLATLFIKASILCFYMRFSVSRNFTIVLRILTAIIVLFYFLAAFVFVYGCQPIRYAWDSRTMEKGKCIHFDAWYASSSGFNFVSDAVLLALPFWIIAPLRVSFVQKAALVAILGAGSFVLAVSMFRFIIVVQGLGNNDYTYRFARNYIWSVVEINVGIACACAPCLRALLGRYFPSFLQLGRREDPELYTIPLSELGQRLPGTPDRRHQDTTTTSAGSETVVTGSWRSKLFGSTSSGSEKGP